MHKILLITGASDGIGATTARLAAERGYTVCINYRSQQKAAEALAAELREKGGQAWPFKADVSDEKAVAAMFRKIDRQFGPVDALVNNAGIIISQQKLTDIQADRLQQMFATNVFGAFYCAREAIKRMSTQRGGSGGSIVNVSSIAARTGSPFEYIDYAATKGAIDSMTIGLAKEVAAEGIRVNAVRPGITLTNIHAKAGEPGRVERLRARIPLLRGGQSEEIARSILWLLSEEASYITGVLLDVSGGM